MSTPTTTSSQPAQPPSQTDVDAPADQVTNPRWSQRWHRWRPIVIVLALLLLPVLITLWMTRTTSSTPLAIDNPKGPGTMAVAELLRHEGISVSKAGSISEARVASRRGATIAVVNAHRLSSEDKQALAQAGGDIVIIGARGGSDALAGLTDMTSKGTAAPASTTLAPLSSQSAVDELTANVRAARDAGVTVEQVGSPVPERGAFFQPTIMTDIPVGSPTASTEFFGPVSSIFRAEDEDDAVRIANSSPFGLGGSVFSNNIHRAQSVARRLDTGMVFINQPTGVAADIPFGGVKRSGYGRELVDLGLKEFVNEKVIAITDIDGQF